MRRVEVRQRHSTKFDHPSESFNARSNRSAVSQECTRRAGESKVNDESSLERCGWTAHDAAAKRAKARDDEL